MYFLITFLVRVKLWGKWNHCYSSPTLLSSCVSEKQILRCSVNHFPFKMKCRFKDSLDLYRVQQISSILELKTTFYGLTNTFFTPWESQNNRETVKNKKIRLSSTTKPFFFWKYFLNISAPSLEMIFWTYTLYWYWLTGGYNIWNRSRQLSLAVRDLSRVVCLHWSSLVHTTCMTSKIQIHVLLD